MAVYGIGAYYESDVAKEFIKKGCVCIGHKQNRATTIYEMLRRAKLGDIIYIKSTNPKAKNTLYIKAIGFIVGQEITPNDEADKGVDLGDGRLVKWVRDYTDNVRTIELKDEDRVNNVYSNTMYEEYSSSIINTLIKWLTEKS